MGWDEGNIRSRVCGYQSHKLLGNRVKNIALLPRIKNKPGFCVQKTELFLKVLRLRLMIVEAHLPPILLITKNSALGFLMETISLSLNLTKLLLPFFEACAL